MRRKALLVLVCCIALHEVLGEPGKSKVNSVNDNVGQETVSPLYRNVPSGVYASTAPYAAYSFHVPSTITAPKNRVIPVNEESVVIQNPSGYLKDSYGNKFTNSPQVVGFKTTFPQQFVQLQDLPLHLSQPLVSNAPAFQFKQGATHFFAPGQFRAQGFQALSPSPFQRYAVSHPVLQNANIRNFAAAPVLQTNFNSHPVVQHQPTSNKAIFVNTQAHEQYNKLKNEPKFQRLQDNSNENASPQNLPITDEQIEKYNHPQPFRTEKEELQAAPAKVASYVNEQNTGESLETKPPLPLLDISLLEPLTFDNPLVPQVQHFLPRIYEATYQKLPNFNIGTKNQNHHEPVEQKPRSYDNEIIKGKPKRPKKKQKSPVPQNHHELDHPIPSITVKGTPNVSPEFSYEINSPNYKETYKEQVVSYNKETKSEPVNYSYKKETQSEPVHYTYGKQVQSKPVQYSYVHNSKEPKQEKQVYYENGGQGPKHLVYTSQTEVRNEELNDQAPKLQQATSGESQDHRAPQKPTHKNNIEHEQYAKVPQSPHHLVPEHRKVEYHHKAAQNDVKENHDFPKSFMDLINAQVSKGQFQPITPEYHRDENVLPTHKPVEEIKVDPNQHIKRPQPERPNNEQNGNYSPNQHIYEKSKRVIIRNETPEAIHLHDEKQNTETADQEENNEENFEKAYKNAAFGFPGYESNSEQNERDIYNPETYGVARDGAHFDIEHAPFQQYYEEGNTFPKHTHASYKDTRDKLKEDYYLDFSINKPESMIDRYNNKLQYYKMYKKHRPEQYFGQNQNQDKEDKQNSKYSIAPTYFNFAPEQKLNQQFARFQAAPQIYEYDYTKEAPRDNSAYGTQPHQRFKTKTQFVEPQFQYGFQPSSIPHLLDSELATMASNIRSESEKPGTRKKLFKENWYIKKTTTLGGSPDS